MIYYAVPDWGPMPTGKNFRTPTIQELSRCSHSWLIANYELDALASRTLNTEVRLMRVWLMTLLVSTVVSVALWQFGLAYIVWPAHPFLATIGIAVVCGVAAQLLLPNAAPPGS